MTRLLLTLFGISGVFAGAMMALFYALSSAADRIDRRRSGDFSPK